MALQIHWRAPLQPKGFLKIIEFFVAMIAFSLVAGFVVSTKNDFTCENNGEFTYKLTAEYSFRTFRETLTRNLSGNVTKQPSKSVTFEDGGVPRSAEFFVAWGVITFLYCVIAVLVYMLVTANERLERVFDIIVVVDIVIHLVLILCWFIASVDWAFAFNNLDNGLNGYMDDQEISSCNGSEIYVVDKDRDHVVYVQAQIAVVFGFLLQLLLAVNIGWLVIDTSWWINWRARKSHTRF